MIEDEISASSAFADWKVATEREEDDLEEEKDEELEKESKNKVLADEQDEKLKTCNTALSKAKENANTACNAYTNFVAAQN